ncbi:hypothetical protein G6F42_016325 [Rhizopus arrhizus]|nr:hypothetical protein G6F42_016325 [Rhizopus arrhizus]
MFVKKFGNNAVLKLQSRREVFSAAMKVNETTDEYSVRFKKAGYSADNSTIGDAFLMGFPKEWQSQINTLLHCAYPDRDCWTTDEISTAALNIFNNDTINLSFVGKSRGLSSTGGDQANKGVKRAKTESYYFPNHGGTAARHNEKDCIKNKGGSSFTGNSSSNSMPQQVSKPKFLGNKNSPHSATTVNTFCTWCGKLWVMGHSCPEYFEKNKGRNVRVLTIRIAGNRKKHDKGKSKADENDKLFRENMEEDSYCEYENKELKKNEFKLITPLLLNNIRMLGKVDPGADISFINKSILNKDFKNVKSMKTMGYLNFLSVNDDGTNCRTKRIGQTEPMEVKYMNGITFKHKFEIIEFSDEMKTDFDILLGSDILHKMNIYLSGVAHAWPDDNKKEMSQFENINYDTDNKYDSENADYGTPEQREKLMEAIQGSLNANKEISPTAVVCSMEESVVRIPIDGPSDCFVRQYPLPLNAHNEIKKPLKEWLDNGVVEKTKPSAVYHLPLLCVPKKDLNGKPTKLRICCDLRKINAAISTNYHENFAVPKIEEIFEKVSANARIISRRIDLHQAYMSYSVHRNSRESLTFSCDGSFYHWSRAPYGLKFMSNLFVKNVAI